MVVPNRNYSTNSYRHEFQGQEKDNETGKESFELRLWDSRIGGLTTVDPYRQFALSY